MRSQGTRESLDFFWRSFETPRYQVNASHCVFYLIFETTTVDKHEYFKMMRAREERIRTFMQLELEAYLEEVNWTLICYNCEVLDCPQEEYPARLLPTLPPSYIDNLQSRLIKARKGIFSPSLKTILKSEYQFPVLRPVPEISVQPDGMIGEHRAGENSPSLECDPSPRRAAVDTGSEEPGTPPQSPAISSGSPGASQAEMQLEEETSSFETSMDGFLNQNFTITEQEPALLHQQDVGVEDDEKETTTTTQQAAVREELVSPTEKQQQRGTTVWGTEQHKLFDRGRSFAMQLNFWKENCFPVYICLLLKMSKYIWDPAPGDVLEGGVRGGEPPLHGCCVQARDRYCDWANNRCSMGGPGGVSPPAWLLCPSTRQEL